MRRHTGIGIIALPLALSGCIFQVGPEVLSERPDRIARKGTAPGDNAEAPGAGGDVVDMPGAPEAEAPQTAAPEPMPPWDFSTRFAAIRDGRILGNIGPATGLNLPTDIAHVYDDGFFTQLAVYALRGDGRRVMLQLQIDNFGEPLFVPGTGKRLRPGYTDGRVMAALACEGSDSGDPEAPLEDTDFDEEPCDVGVDTEQNPEDPSTLRVTLQATFADDNGDCLDDEGPDLPDLDDDGDGDLPDPGSVDDAPIGDGDGGGNGGGGGDGTGNNRSPLSATASFTLVPE